MGKQKKRHPIINQLGPIVTGLYIPAFIHIHFRYARHNFKIWTALFIAPFLVVKLVLIRLIKMLPEQNAVVWHFDLLAVLVISIFFYLAERFDNFRRVYVWAVPVTIFCGLIYWFSGTGSHEKTGLMVKFLLIAYFSYRVGKFTISRGYEELNEGADSDYHTGKEFYDEGVFDKALSYLEKSAKRGHFKSLYLLGEAYEHGHHYKEDTAKAVAYYYLSSRKGYMPANKRYHALLNQLSSDEALALDQHLRRFTHGGDEASM